MNKQRQRSKNLPGLFHVHIQLFPHRGNNRRELLGIEHFKQAGMHGRGAGGSGGNNVKKLYEKSKQIRLLNRKADIIQPNSKHDVLPRFRNVHQIFRVYNHHYITTIILKGEGNAAESQDHKRYGRCRRV